GWLRERDRARARGRDRAAAESREDSLSAQEPVRTQAEVALQPLRRRLIIGACANDDRRLLAKVADEDVDALLKPAQMVHDRADILTHWNLNADLGDLLPAANRGVADGIRGE